MRLKPYFSHVRLIEHNGINQKLFNYLLDDNRDSQRMLDHPSPLPKAVEASASNRPVKIAYLVAQDESPENHMALDGVYYEAYTRWGGAYTLIVPVSSEDFLHPGYDKWLQHYDPDLVYTYVDIDQAFVQRIDSLCTPIAFLKHEFRNHNDRPTDWHSYIPHWEHYVRPISSITTLPSPATLPVFLPPIEHQRETFIFMQYDMESPNRFLADNFGASLPTMLNGIPSFFSTLCLTQPDLPPHIHAGTERCTSQRAALAALTDRQAIPIARLAMNHSEAIPRIESTNWAYAFQLFIGKTVIDRIYFWNCRQLTFSESTPINSLVVDKAFFEDETLVKQLGQYLNRTNFLSPGSGQYQVELHSASENKEVLISIREKLAAHTWNAIHVSRTINAAPVPTDQDLKRGVNNRFTDTRILKLTEEENQITAKEPAHFIYVPPRLKRITEGQWIVELSIQRHNNLSKFSNVVDRWVLPKRGKITRAFTQQRAKPTRAGNLAVLPIREELYHHRQRINNPYSYELNLPDDKTFFRYLTLEFSQYIYDDCRASISRPAYVDLAISDKGQNLRGVISMLGHLSTAYELFTNKYWRTVLSQAKEDATKPLTFKRNMLESFLPNDRASTQKLANELGLPNRKTASTYLKNNLADTLEHLVRINVFYLVANWRCSYCGHTNSRNFDNMRIRNECDICYTEYLAPIDIEWKYELNDFVYRSLSKHSGLPVLWTLGFLHDQNYGDNYWYLPEVDLFESYDNPDLKNEIDILCMLDGKFYAVEVKKSASIFLNKPNAIDKYLKVINMLRPDVAMLSFERYSMEKNDIDDIKSKLQDAEQSITKNLAPGIILEIRVAEDINQFNNFSHDLGWCGHRTMEETMRILNRSR